jgi:hypothetical protein
LKDLQRFLRKDDPDMRPVFFKLGGFHLAANDLVPLVVTYPNEHDVVYNARECFEAQPHTSQAHCAHMGTGVGLSTARRQECFSSMSMSVLMAWQPLGAA